jgi:hypothetical protein
MERDTFGSRLNPGDPRWNYVQALVRDMSPVAPRYGGRDMNEWNDGVGCVLSPQ